MVLVGSKQRAVGLGVVSMRFIVEIVDLLVNEKGWLNDVKYEQNRAKYTALVQTNLRLLSCSPICDTLI